MRIIISLIVGIAMGYVISACGTSVFPYTWYGYDYSAGKLLANSSSGASDEPVSICAATSTSAAPCLVILESEALKLKAAYETQAIQLQDCQKQLQDDGN